MCDSTDQIAPPQPISRPKLSGLKAKQQVTWASGDFSMVAAKLVLQAELLCEVADLQANWRVLDVAAGSGNASIAAARRGCGVVGLDYVPALLEVGRERGRAERLDVEFIEGDAENLPFPDASFDAVLSIYGAMFAPDHHRTAAEMARVCRPGGVIALASWTPQSLIGERFRLIGKFIPPVAGSVPAVQWGDEAHLREIFGDAIGSITSTVRTAFFRFASSRTDVNFFRRHYGPTRKAFESLSDLSGHKLEQEMIQLNNRFDRNGGNGGPVALAADYLETVIIRA